MDWNYIEMCWRDAKQKSEVEKRLSMEVQGAENPHLCVAQLLEQCLRHLKGKPSKTPMMLLTILERQPPGRHPLSHQVKEAALNSVLRQKNSSVFAKVCQLYRLSDSPADFLPTCQSLVHNKKYNEACLLITALKLQDHFTVQDVLIPLFLQDKMQNAENYLKGHRDLQVQFVKFLDSLLTEPRKPYSVASSLGVPEIKAEKLYSKTIGKLVARLLKAFDIPPETCSNLCMVRGMGALKYLVNRRFSEGTVDDQNWSDLVLGAVGENRDLQKELLVLLVSYNEPREALRWALHFKVERHLWPPILEEILIRSLDSPPSEDRGGSVSSVPSAVVQEVPTKAPAQEEELWELQEATYLPFRLSRSDIILVETPEQYMKCIDDVQNYDVLAMDGEWKPSFGMQQEKLSLLQLAVWDCVFLLDILALQRTLGQFQWQLLIDQVICNPRINKLSYGFTSDIQQLGRMVPAAKAKLQKMENMFDFALLYPKFQLHCPDLVSPCQSSVRGGPQDSKGLSNLTLSTLGLPLDKSMQFSDWDKRPLREHQVLYAALDAYCLLQIFEVWHQRALDQGQNFFELVLKARSSTQTSSPQKGKTQKQKQQVGVCDQLVLGAETCDQSRPSMAITELRVVVDTMLQGLGKHLRICGVDTHILETEDYHDEAAKVAQREGRVILTSGAPYQQLKQHVPVGHCLNIPNGLTSQEQSQIVFRHFNVRLQKEDIFSRCCACNGARYVEIPCQDLQQMWQKLKKPEWGRQECHLVEYPGGTVEVSRGLVSGRVSILLHQLNPQVFERVSVFFVCADCGKVYWEGSHHGRVMKKLQPLMAGQPDKSVALVEKEQECRRESPAAKESTSSRSTSLPPPPEMYLNSDDEDNYQDNNDYYM